MNLSEKPDTLSQNLVKKYKSFDNRAFVYGGLEIDQYHRVRQVNGRICPNIYALGLPTEGSKYFTLALGRPNMVSAFLHDSNKVAQSISHELGFQAGSIAKAQNNPSGRPKTVLKPFIHLIRVLRQALDEAPE